MFYENGKLNAKLNWIAISRSLWLLECFCSLLESIKIKIAYCMQYTHAYGWKLTVQGLFFFFSLCRRFINLRAYWLHNMWMNWINNNERKRTKKKKANRMHCIGCIYRFEWVHHAPYTSRNRLVWNDSKHLFHSDWMRHTKIE